MTMILIFIGMFFLDLVPIDCHGNELKVTMNRGAVSTQDETCRILANKALAKGANAVDAGLLATMCLSIYNQQSTSFGGSGFATVFDRKRKLERVYYMRPSKSLTSRINRLEEVCVDPQTKRNRMYFSVLNPSPETVAMPMILQGINRIHRDHGLMPIKELLQILIDHIKADNNIIFLSKQAIKIKNKLPIGVANSMAKVLNMKSSKEFYSANQFPGDDSIKFLQDIQKYGIESVYGKDSIFVTELLKYSDLTKEDIKINQVFSSKPQSLSFYNYKIIVPELPSGGLFVKFGLELFESISKHEFGSISLNNNDILAFVLNEVYINLPILEVHNYKNLLSKSEKSIIKSIESFNEPFLFHRHHIPEFNLKGSQGGTSHVSVVDDNDMAISITSSVNRNHGSGIILPTQKIVLNDDNCDFLEYLDTDKANDEEDIIEVRKPIKSSMSPVIFYNSQTLCSIGSKGSQKIVQGVIQGIINYVKENKSAEDSLSSPRIYFYENQLEYESSFKYYPFSPIITKYFNPIKVSNALNKIYMSCNTNGSQPIGVSDPRDLYE